MLRAASACCFPTRSKGRRVFVTTCCRALGAGHLYFTYSRLLPSPIGRTVTRRARVALHPVPFGDVCSGNHCSQAANAPPFREIRSHRHGHGLCPFLHGTSPVPAAAVLVSPVSTSIPNHGDGGVCVYYRYTRPDFTVLMIQVRRLAFVDGAKATVFHEPPTSSRVLVLLRE